MKYKELSVQEYMELVQSEGLLTKSLSGDAMTSDAIGSEIDEDEELDKLEDEEVEDEEEEEDDDEMIVTLTIVTADIDRIKDILNPLGCQTEDFARNPLFLWEHGKQRPLADSLLGQVKSLTLTEKGITAQAKYMPHDAFTNKIMMLERKGMLPGNSIGWRPLSGIKLYDDGKRYVDQWELLECSKVVLPTNGKATNLRLAA
jgi:Caudovirus prohead serine protease